MDTTSSSSSDEEELTSSECEMDETSCDAEDVDDDDEDDEDDDINDEDDEEKLETAKICGATLQLPQHLCESKDIFREFFSLKTFNSLSEINKQHLKNFLPSFPENDEQEKNTTLQKLFNRETFRFNSPLNQFHVKLKAGHFRPDIARMRKLLKQEQRKEYKFQQKVYYKKILQDLMTSRQRLLDVANNLPPGIDLKLDKSDATADESSPRAFRAKRRYFQELAQIKSQVDDSVDWSEDENYPEGPPVRLSKKLRRHLNGLQNSGNFQNVPNSEKTVTSTLASKPGGGLDLENSVTATYNPYQLNEDSYRALLFAHKKRKHSLDPDLVTKGLNIREVAQRTQLTPSKKTICAVKPPAPANEYSVKIKKKKLLPEPIKPQTSNSEGENSDSDEYIDPVVSPALPALKTKSPRNKFRQQSPKQQSPKAKAPKAALLTLTKPEFEPKTIKTEPEEKALIGDLAEEVEHPQISLSENLMSPIVHRSRSIIPASLSDLDGIDMMSLPVDLEDSNIDILDDIDAIETHDQLIESNANIKHELLMQETHSNFLSLIRDIICSTIEHRMSLTDIEERLKGWQTNPISPLNTWYSLVDNWLGLLPSAVTFLTGEMLESPEDYVPYLEFKPNLHLYQWIGAGRDSDNRLNALCQYWLEHRDDNLQTLISSATAVKKLLPSTPEEMQVVKPATPPPPRHPTNWIVRKAEPQEVEEFREQERQRYANPHKSFTYKMNGYESIVGPVKGMYNQTSGLSKARGHSMLNADRPNFVTILTLVRDAVARLPNGEGTRADICELLKSSQYISHCAPENVLQSVVSGALDRLHTEYDPSVKYDTKKKIWIYLHRNRTEADFERIHQQFQGLSKQFKKSSRKNKTPKAKPVQQQPQQTQQTQQPQQLHQLQQLQQLQQPQPQPERNPAQIQPTTPTKQMKPLNDPLTGEIPPSAETTPQTLQNLQTLQNIQTPQPLQTLQTQQPPQPAEKFKPPPVNRLFNQSNCPSPTNTTQLPAHSPKPPGASLLVSNKQMHSPKPPPLKPETPSEPPERLKIITSSIAPTDQDIEKAIQTLTPIRVASPITTKVPGGAKPQKSLVKIINSPQGKSLITPSSNHQTVFIKQIDSKTTIAGKNILAQPQITQQLLNTIAAQQKLKQQPKQPIIVTTQQLIKNDGQKTVQTIANAQLLQQQQLLQTINQKQTISVSSQQILQTIKQKVQNQQSVLTLQQAINKQTLQQKINQQQHQQQQQQQQLTKGTSLLGQQRILTQGSHLVTGGKTAPNQTPLVAKVLTNAAGQVISVESLLAHQKQHGTLPQGTTLRVSGAKPGQTNLIQLSSSAPNQIQQYAVVSQTSAKHTTTAVTSTKKFLPGTAATTGTAPTGGGAVAPPNKLAHQLVNAKFVANKAHPTQKLITQPLKINAVKQTPQQPGKLTSAPNVRMVNTTGLNLASFAGKPILLASKANTIQNLQTLQGGNVILQAQANLQTSNSIVLPGNARVLTQTAAGVSAGGATGGATAGVVLNAAAAQLNQLKVQNLNSGQQIVLGQNMGKVVAGTPQPQGNTAGAQTVVLGGAIKMAGANNRVVLASQGSSGQIVTQQILLPSNFQGGAINIKTLQGLKVIPLAQTTQQTKGRPQVFARIMNPQNARIAAAQVSNPQTQAATHAAAHAQSNASNPALNNLNNNSNNINNID